MPGRLRPRASARSWRCTSSRARTRTSTRRCRSAASSKAEMVLGQVVGTVVATQKEPSLNGLKLLLVRGVDLQGKASGATVVAADAVGAGVGEMVLYASGSS